MFNIILINLYKYIYKIYIKIIKYILYNTYIYLIYYLFEFNFLYLCLLYIFIKILFNNFKGIFQIKAFIFN